MLPSVRLILPRLRTGLLCLLGTAALALLVEPAPAAAQFGGSTGPRVESAFIVGARGGYDFKSDAPLLGLFARTAVAGRVAVQGTADLTFLDGLTERQAGVDLLVRLGGQGLFVGGGPVWRSSIFPDETGFTQIGTERETKLGYSLVGVLGGLPGRGRFLTAVEFRFTVVDELKAQLLTLQFGLPLARW